VLVQSKNRGKEQSISAHMQKIWPVIHRTLPGSSQTIQTSFSKASHTDFCKTSAFAQLQLMTQQARASSLPEILPAENAFAFPEWGRLRNDCKRRRRRRPEGVAHSTWLTPHRVPQHAPRAFAMAVHFGARIPFPVRGREPTAPNP
jgi:hypothetical protein